MNTNVSILIGGDFVPTPSNYELFQNFKTNELFGESLLRILKKADSRIFNLETPLTDCKTPIEKCGPALIAPVNTINGIKAIDTTLFCLANNHILDQGMQGLESTITALTNNGIMYSGAGYDLTEAKKPTILRIKDKAIGFYCCAEHEFSIASDTEGGANPFDLYTSFEHISALSKKCDYVIVMYHGGKELYQYPSPKNQISCRKMIESGANIVICQHSHCVGCEEDYLSGKIIYGQGNFIFDRVQNDLWNTGLLINIMLENNNSSVNYIPIVKDGNVIRCAENEIEQEILKGFYERSEKIKNKDFVKTNYKKFALNYVNEYITRMFVFRIINYAVRLVKKIIGTYLFRRLCSKQLMMALLNIIECEAHHELFLTGLKEILKKENIYVNIR